MANIYLFYGEEKYDLESSVNKIKKGFENLQNGLNLFYITNDNINELSNVIEGVSFFGAEKLVIIKDTKLKINVELLKNMQEGIIVIIIEDSVDKRTSEYKTLVKIAECVEFKQLNEKGMVTYITQVLKKYNINITNENAKYMQEICGLDKTNIINELQKLVVYLEDNVNITKDIIDKVCVKTLHAQIFDVLNKIVNKQKKEALVELDKIIKQKEPIIKISIMLYKQIKQMYLIKYLKDKNEKNIIEILKIHPFVFKNLSKSTDCYSLSELRKIIKDFDEYDEKTKIGEMDFEIGLKKIICSM